MAVLGPRFCARAFSSCGKRGPPFIAMRGPLTIAASLVAEHGLQTRRLSSYGSRAQLLRGMACGILPDQGSNPCPLHWQADSQPLCHQGSPILIFLIHLELGFNIMCFYLDNQLFPFFKKFFLSRLTNSANSVNYQVSVYVWICFQVLYSVSLVYLSISVLKPTLS